MIISEVIVDCALCLFSDKRRHCSGVMALDMSENQIITVLAYLAQKLGFSAQKLGFPCLSVGVVSVTILIHNNT
jgi:hypothetical protein